ncbi:class I adenylate-forming enzyme family protein [Actinomadura syzygii]|uniref:Acyl--CoA ligase n=1 Tax=Actinomadura syzygii TaxID=1427538 RepID=A0A5D0TY94_9ACTN|nr:class I adenylate-forming enzyme family protein [Actinomadura syzygii]TYC10346.1 acyl--CoA ligase [Actinomadura syzygii]
MTTLLHDLLDATAARRPGHVAVRDHDTELRYADLAARSRRLGDWLRGTGVRRHDRVLLALPAGVDLAALVYACSRVGAVFVVLRPDTPAAVAAHVCADSAATLMVTDSQPLRRVAAEHRIAAYRPPDAAHPTHGGPDGPPPVPVLPVDPACFVYTSGSVAMPKAVVSTHQQMTFAAGAVQSRLLYGPADVVYNPLPLSFDYGLYQLFLCAIGGARLHLATAEDAGHRLVARLAEASATVLPAVPSLAANLARLLERRPAPLPRLRLITNTGAAMPDDLLRRLRRHLPQTRIQLMYGLTECKRATIMDPDEDLERPGACGRALPGTEVYTVDDHGRRLPPGQIGEVVVRGPHVMAGYWRHPRLTAQRFHRAEGLFPELRTGDYGRLDETGCLYFVGRRDDLYKERGVRVSTIEVEAAALRVPGVHAAAVVPPSDGTGGATLFVRAGLSSERVLNALRDELEEAKVPTRCVVMDELPLNAHGKIERRALASLAGAADD